MSFEYGDARCRCRNVFPAVQSVAVPGRGLVCPSCGLAYVVRLQVRTAQVQFSAAKRGGSGGGSRPGWTPTPYQPKQYQRTAYQPKQWRRS